MNFTVVTWNVLAPSYAHPERYPRTARADLAAEVRRSRMLDRLRALDADLVCLQELEPAWFEAVAAAFPDHEGVYGQKRDKPDGSAVFVRRSRFSIRQREVVHFKAAEPNYDHVAVLVSGELDGEPVGVASTHLRWQPEGTPVERHLGRLQLLEVLDRTLGGRWIVCGDFNALSQSPVMDAARERGFDEACRTQRPWDTVNIDGRRRKLDYLLFTAGAWVPRPSPLPRLERDTPMPGPEHASDHLPVHVGFERG